MDWNELERKLISAARPSPPDQVPYAFEKRITARLRSGPGPAPDAPALWARALWRSAVACTGLAVLLGVLTLAAPPRPASTNLSEELEQTLLAAVDQDNPALR
jgi:hypothetical protein